MGSGSALEVVLHDYALYKSTFTLLYPSTACVPITVLLYDGPLLCGFNGAIKATYEQLNSDDDEDQAETAERMSVVRKCRRTSVEHNSVKKIGRHSPAGGVLRCRGQKS